MAKISSAVEIFSALFPFCRSLKKLVLDENEDVCDLSGVELLEQLEALSLADTSVKDEKLMPLRHLSHLTDIDLYDSPITRANVPYLMALPQLKRFVLGLDGEIEEDSEFGKICNELESRGIEVLENGIETFAMPDFAERSSSEDLHLVQDLSNLR